MSYKICYGKEKKRTPRAAQIVIIQSIAASLLLMIVLCFAHFNEEIASRIFVADSSQPASELFESVSSGEEFRAAAIRYCREKLKESGYVG